MQFIYFLVCLFFLMFSSVKLHADDLAVRHCAGAQARALAVRDNYWYQALGEKVIVLKKNSGDQMACVPLAMPAGALCTDLLIDGDTLYGLLDGDEVIVLDISSPQTPVLVSRMRGDALGIRPRRFTRLGDSVLVMGEGGAVRLADGSAIVTCEDEVTGVFNTSGNGVVYAMNRRLYSVDSQQFLGSATEVHTLEASANAPVGTHVFVRALDGKTEVGFMRTDLKEVGELGKAVVAGDFADILLRGSRVYLVTSKGVFVFGVSPKELRLLREFSLDGISSIDIVASNYFALCGNFGYGLYRIEDDRGGDGQTLFRVVSANGPMRAGSFDGRGVQVETEDGLHYYSFDGEFSPCDSDHTTQSIGTVRVPTSAVVLGAQAVIGESGVVTLRTSKGDVEVTLPSPARTVVAVAGDFWFGTENGIYIVGQREDESLLVGLQLAGPIVQLIPFLDGSVGFVSGAGVVGVVENN